MALWALLLFDSILPPRVVPHPLSFPGGGGGGGGPSLGQPKIFRCGSLCCCVGGCVVGHYHLHPLHSWQDVLLTFAEMELDNTTMFPLGTSVMFSLPRAPSPPRPAQSEASSSTRAEQRALVHRSPKRSLQSTLHAFLKPRDPPQEEDEDVAPHGGGGGLSLGDHPPGGGGGPSSLGWGTTGRGGEGTLLVVWHADAPMGVGQIKLAHVQALEML